MIIKREPQIKDLIVGVEKAASILSRCPSCFKNFLQNICAFTCSPHQSSFINVIDKKINAATNRKSIYVCRFESIRSRTFQPIRSTGTFVNEIDLYITERFINDSYKSCKNVIFPSSGQLGLDLMCGSWGAAKCSPTRWYHFMGNSEEDVVPFQINYIARNSSEVFNGFTPFDPRVVPCNESVDVR